MQAVNEEELKAAWVEEFQLQALSPEKQEELIGKMIEALLKRVHVATYERLGDANIDEYERMLGDDVKDEDFAQWLEGKIPGYDAFVADVVTKFNKEMKETLGVA